ncbi:hypothetical protein JXC34_05670 [Candidatus Woesearchaeota archaeon]|nr:hypothetical protein [Candidatus Woesearchaeota archaeon]
MISLRSNKKALQFDMTAIFIILLITLAVLILLAVIFSGKIYDIIDALPF